MKSIQQDNKFNSFAFLKPYLSLSPTSNPSCSQSRVITQLNIIYKPVCCRALNEVMHKNLAKKANLVSYIGECDIKNGERQNTPILSCSTWVKGVWLPNPYSSTSADSRPSFPDLAGSGSCQHPSYKSILLLPARLESEDCTYWAPFVC